jgi:KipI family sensor histidine kinase inhibitor
MMNPTINISVAGENSLILYLADNADSKVAAQIQSVTALITESLGPMLIDIIPSYASILIIYDPHLTDHFAVSKEIQKAMTIHANSRGRSASKVDSKLVKLPVYYGTDAGPDLENLASNARLSVEEVINIHQSIEYRVYAIGFAPGFAYLGEVDERIAAPRLSTPRQRVPRGAVAIADRQTAVYPSISPGGWNLIGLCPILMFDPNAEPTMPVKTGDRVQFESIDEQAFIKLGGDLSSFGDLK